MKTNIYACTKLRNWHEDTSGILSEQLEFSGFGPEVDGIYRRVDDRLLSWIDYQLRLKAPKENADAEAVLLWDKTVMFYHELLELTGITPSGRIPAGYGPPDPSPDWPFWWQFTIDKIKPVAQSGANIPRKTA